MNIVRKRTADLPVARQTLADQIVEYVRDQISQDILKPGQKLTIQGLAKELNVSMTPIREAIKTLAALRLVDVEVNKSVVIAQPNMEETRQLLIVYSRLEMLAGELAAQNATAEDIASLKELAGRLVAAQQQGKKLEYFHINQEFHLVLVMASHNQPLIEIHQNLNARLYHVRFRGIGAVDVDWGDVAKEHNDIVAAIEKHDSKDVAALVKKHFRGAYQRAIVLA